MENPTHISESVLMSIRNHVNHGIQCGSFLHAVLCNDLCGAVQKADMDNRKALPLIVSFIINHIPAECHGSPAKVDAWQRKLAR